MNHYEESNVFANHTKKQNEDRKRVTTTKWLIDVHTFRAQMN